MQKFYIGNLETATDKLVEAMKQDEVTPNLLRDVLLQLQDIAEEFDIEFDGKKFTQRNRVW